MPWHLLGHVDVLAIVEDLLPFFVTETWLCKTEVFKLFSIVFKKPCEMVIAHCGAAMSSSLAGKSMLAIVFSERVLTGVGTISVHIVRPTNKLR